MQEIHSIGGGGIFGGGGDRRLRPHHQNHHQALKCPRCDSLNTKFCYYNNYNLSQPRHFCKNCRRYWTKGGVLRNVPVGGGCRKSKRSNKPKNNSNGDNNNTSSSETAPATTPTPQPPPEAERKANSHSSSESSTLTAAATEAMSAPTSNAAFLSENVRESKVLANPPLELEHVGNGGDHSGIFSEIGTFTSLITSTNEALAFGFGNNSNVLDASSFRFSVTRQRRNDPLQAGVAPDCSQLGQCQWQQQNQEFAAASLFNHTVPVVFSPMQNRTDHGGFGSLDWHVPADQSLLHLPNTFDQTYWSHTQWSDQDNHTLFPLP